MHYIDHYAVVFKKVNKDGYGTVSSFRTLNAARKLFDKVCNVKQLPSGSYFLVARDEAHNILKTYGVN